MNNNLATPQDITLEDFNYPLPESLIAKYPLEQRDASKMMVVNRKTGTIEHTYFKALQKYLNPGDLIVLNNAKVSPVRLIGKRAGFTGEVEIFLLHPQNASQTEWLALIRPAKKLKEGTHVIFENSDLSVQIVERQENGKARVSLNWPEHLSFNEMLEQVGHIPLPSYLSRNEEILDKHRYQTVFAKTPGAQAAPTAGLHFTEDTLNQLKSKGIDSVEITLYVSAGTFRPVTHSNPLEHKMDPEAYEMNAMVAEKIMQTKRAGHKVIAIGTTVVKTLETIAYKNNGQLKADTGWSELFIAPPFNFKIVDALLTNFHLPKSTLLMLVSAFANNNITFIQKAYQEAIEQQYRFYSYGDCMLIH